MDQKEKEDNKEQEQTPGSSYKVHFDETKGPAFLGDNCKYYQDQRHFVVVQVYPGSGLPEQETIKAISENPVLCQKVKELRQLPEEEKNSEAFPHDDAGIYDDTKSTAPRNDSGYQLPINQTVKGIIDSFELEERRQINNINPDASENERKEKNETLIPPQNRTEEIQDTGNCNIDEEDGNNLQSSSVTSATLAENVIAFCETANSVEQMRLTEIIQTQLNSLSIGFSNCTICPAEYKLRTFLLGDDTSKVMQGIGIYASILTVMLQHGLQPQLNDEETMQRLLLCLKKIVEPPHFFPLSSVRRDIETVIKMLTAFKEEKITKATKLIVDVKNDLETKMMKQYIGKYLESKSWTQHYLIISWLKVQVLVLRKKYLVFALLQFIKHLSENLNRMSSSYRWKFTITVVDCLVQVAREISDIHRIPETVMAGLSELFLVLQQKNLYKCIDIFHQRARNLVFIDNLHIRNALLGGIYKELDTTSEEMCKEKIKLCKNLKLSAVREMRHNGSHAWFFAAHSNNSEVVIKCYKQTRRELVAKHSDPHPHHFDYEYDALSRLEHPNVVKLLDSDKYGKCLMLEPVSKGSLLTFLRYRRGSTLKPKLIDLLPMALMIAEALEFLEKKNIIHLAMQAANVLLHDNGTVKLTGFQFCRTLEQIEKSGVQKAIVKSHFKWMDPQALLYESISKETVSWSFGIFLYELLTFGCVPYNHPKSCPEHGDFKRTPLTSVQAQVFVIRGGILEKESCIPKSMFSIISEKCLLRNYSSRATPHQLKELFQKLINEPKMSDKICRPPPRLIFDREDLNSENCNPGTNDHDDELPFAHLEIVDQDWNQKYHGQEFATEEGYTNADPSQFVPLLCIIKQQRGKLKEWKRICLLEYMEFKDIKLAEKLQNLKYPELVRVIAVNRFGPNKLEMISESLPQGNVLDALLNRPELHQNITSYIRQAGLAVHRLHEEGIVHRDLKVENYLMQNDQIIKLGRLGMSMEEIDVNAEYCDPKDLKMPKMVPDPRRNAPEVLNYRSYTRKSDVWSFGVVVWEFSKIASLGGTGVTRKDVVPYSEISDNEIFAFVMDKNLLPNPEQYSRCHLYNAYKTCWNWNAEDRPSILTVLDYITTSYFGEQELTVELNNNLRRAGPHGADHVYDDRLDQPPEGFYDDTVQCPGGNMYVPIKSSKNARTVFEEEELYENIDVLTSENTAVESGEEFYEPIDVYTSNTLSGFVLPPCENSSRAPQLDIAAASCDYRAEKQGSEINEQDDTDYYETYYDSDIYGGPEQERDLYYNTDHEYSPVCDDDERTPETGSAPAFHEYDIGESCGDTSLNEEEATDDYETYDSGIYAVPKNQHDLYYNTEHEYSPVCNNDVIISSAPDTLDPSGEQVDDVHNSISEQESGEDNAQEDISAEEVVDIAFNTGSQGHVKNMIALFSDPDR